jgi:hypothetical protein
LISAPPILTVVDRATGSDPAASIESVDDPPSLAQAARRSVKTVGITAAAARQDRKLKAVAIPRCCAVIHPRSIRLSRFKITATAPIPTFHIAPAGPHYLNDLRAGS